MCPVHDDDEGLSWEAREALDDPEGPQAGDLDDEEETPTVPCPSCGEEIPDFADRCPYCGDWVVQGGGRSARSLLFIAVAVLLIVALLFWLL